MQFCSMYIIFNNQIAVPSCTTHTPSNCHPVSCDARSFILWNMHPQLLAVHVRQTKVQQANDSNVFVEGLDSVTLCPSTSSPHTSLDLSFLLPFPAVHGARIHRLITVTRWNYWIVFFKFISSHIPIICPALLFEFFPFRVGLAMVYYTLVSYSWFRIGGPLLISVSPSFFTAPPWPIPQNCHRHRTSGIDARIAVDSDDGPQGGCRNPREGCVLIRRRSDLAIKK